MQSTRRMPWLVGGSVLLCLLLTLVAVVPPRTAEAVNKLLTVDNNLSDFEQGFLVRTALVRDPENEGEENPDSRDGGIQLANIGVIDNSVRPNFVLPQRINSHSAVALGDSVYGQYIYVMGGITIDTNQPTGREPLDLVWSGKVAVDDVNILGDPVSIILNDDNQWDAQLSLKQTRGLTDTTLGSFTRAITATYDMAATALYNPLFDPEEEYDEETNPAPRHYIYLIGGRALTAGVSGTDYTVNTVRIATVNPFNGQIEKWDAADDNVDGNLENLRPPVTEGLAGASAATATINGTTYLYLVGGETSILERARGSKKTYYARIDPRTGLFYRPSTTENIVQNQGWEEVPGELPLEGPTPTNPVDEDGLRYASMLYTRAFSDTQALYLVGGKTLEGRTTPPIIPSRITARVYQGDIQPNGQVTWQLAGTMPETLIGHAAIMFRNKIYVTGGREQLGSEPIGYTLEAYLNTDLTLFNLATTGETPRYFQPSDEDDIFPRAEHATVVAPDGFGAGIAYVLGGAQPDPGTGADFEATDTVLVARVGQEDLPERSDYMPDGFYVSRVYAINELDPQITSIFWETDYPDDDPLVDVVLSYRTSTAVNCDDPGWDESDWRELDVLPDDPRSSNNGDNSFETDDSETVRCFQYRAYLVRNGSTRTPQLRNVSIGVFIPGTPDLRVQQLDPVWNPDEDGEPDVGNLRDFDIIVENLYPPDPSMTLAATVADLPSQNGTTFWVDLVIFGPGYNDPTNIISPTLPITTPGRFRPPGSSEVVTSTATIQVRKSALGPRQQVRIPSGSTDPQDTWCLVDANGVNDCSEPIRLAELFDAGGDFSVCLLLDSYVKPTDLASTLPDYSTGYVPETLPGALDNNFYCEDITVTAVGEPPPPPPPPPTVTLEVGFSNGVTNTNIITKGMDVEGLLTVTRDVTDTTDPLTVTFTLTGTASIGTDYELLQGSQIVTNTFIIPSGQVSTTITLRVMPDAEIAEGGEDVRLILTGNGNLYQLVGNTQTEVRITEVNEPPPPTVYLPLITR